MIRSSYHHQGLRFAVAESGHGHPVVFQHGLCGDATQPADVFPALDGWRCVTLECRGHGRSESGEPAAFSIARFTEDLRAFIQERLFAPVIVGGISMGAAIALRLAVTCPELTTALVIARPAWLSQPAPANMQPNAMVGELLRQHDPDTARELFLTSQVAARLSLEAPDNLASLRGFFARTPSSVTAELLCRISMDGPGVSDEEICALRVPALVVGTDHDAVHPLDYARILTDMIPRAQFVAVTSKSVDPAAYRHQTCAALAAFLQEVAPF